MHLVRRVGLLSILSLTALVGARSSAGPSSAGDPPTLNPGLLSYNRYTSFRVGEFGANFLLGNGDLVSYRFTNRGDRDVQSLWLYLRRVDPSPASLMILRVSLREDDQNGQPVQSELSHARFVPRSGGWVWQRVTLEDPVSLLDGTRYHLVIEPMFGISDIDYVELIATLNRFPVPFLPYDHGRAPHEISPYDAAIEVMRHDGTGPVNPLAQRGTYAGYTPIFLLEDLAGGPAFGNPYNRRRERDIFGQRRFGQALTPDQDLTVNYFAMFVRGGPEQASGAPTHDLEFQIVPHLGDGSVGPELVSGVLIDKDERLYEHRSHWFAASFPAVTLSAGQEYFLVLFTDAVGVGPYDRYIFTYENSIRTGLPASSLPTFGADRSYAVKSSDHGVSYEPIGPNADTAFMLGDFPDASTAPRGFHDEWAQVPPTLPSGPHVLQLVVRNIGQDSSDGELYAQLINALTLAPESPLVPIPATLGNHETKDIFVPFDMRSQDLFMFLEMGHLDTSGLVQIMDERIPLEFRLE